MKIIFADIFKPICLRNVITKLRHLYSISPVERDRWCLFYSTLAPPLSYNRFKLFTVAEQPTTLEASIQKVGAKRKNLILGCIRMPGSQSVSRGKNSLIWPVFKNMNNSWLASGRVSTRPERMCVFPLRPGLLSEKTA
jgi:hypothetical protein